MSVRSNSHHTADGEPERRLRRVRYKPHERVQRLPGYVGERVVDARIDRSQRSEDCVELITEVTSTAPGPGLRVRITTEPVGTNDEHTSKIVRVIKKSRDVVWYVYVTRPRTSSRDWQFSPLELGTKLVKLPKGAAVNKSCPVRQVGNKWCLVYRADMRRRATDLSLIIWIDMRHESAAELSLQASALSDRVAQLGTMVPERFLLYVAPNLLTGARAATGHEAPKPRKRPTGGLHGFVEPELIGPTGLGEDPAD